MENQNIRDPEEITLKTTLKNLVLSLDSMLSAKGTLTDEAQMKGCTCLHLPPSIQESVPRQFTVLERIWETHGAEP